MNAYFHDSNGEKGGIDKHFRVVIHLRRRPTLVIEDRDSDLAVLISRVLDRVGQAAHQQLARSRGSKGAVSMSGDRQPE